MVLYKCVVFAYEKDKSVGGGRPLDRQADEEEKHEDGEKEDIPRCIPIIGREDECCFHKGVK